MAISNGSVRCSKACGATRLRLDDTKRPLPLCLLALSLAFVAVGCGGGGGGSTSSTTSTSHSASAGSKSQPAGDNSIQTFGSEAAGSDRDAIVAAMQGYLSALGNHDDAKACSYLAASVQQSLEQIVVKQLKAKGCPAILPKLLSPTAAPISRQQASGDITLVRVKGDRAFVLFHAPGANLYVMTMVREKGAWKAASIAADVLIPSPATLGQGVRR